MVLRLTPAQRLTFDSYRSFLRGTYEDMLTSKADFPLSIVLLEDGDRPTGRAPQPAAGGL